jgi:hypothetical protein
VVPHDWPHAAVSVPAVVLVGPSAIASTEAGTIRRFAMSEVPLSMLGVVAVVGHHYLRHKNHLECCMSVRPSEKLSFHKHTFVSLLMRLRSRICTMKAHLW